MYGRALWRLIYPLTNWCLQTNKSPFQTFQLIWRHLNVLASQWHSLATLARLIALSHVNEWARTRSHLLAIPLRLCELRYTTTTFHLWFRFEMRLKHLSMMYFSCSWFRKALGLCARGWWVQHSQQHPQMLVKETFRSAGCTSHNTNHHKCNKFLVRVATTAAPPGCVRVNSERQCRQFKRLIEPNASHHVWKGLNTHLLLPCAWIFNKHTSAWI